MSRDTHTILTGDWLRTANALLGELLSEAVSAVWLLISRRELLSHQHLVAAGARETFAVPRRSFVRYSAFVDHLHAAATTHHYSRSVLVVTYNTRTVCGFYDETTADLSFSLFLYINCKLYTVPSVSLR